MVARKGDAPMASSRSAADSSQDLTCEAVAEWFLRLNGYLTIPNFVLHPVNATEGAVQRTDADIVAYRLPFRSEKVGGVVLQDHELLKDERRPRLVIAEVKATQCKLNGPWSDKSRGNVPLLLRAIGLAGADDCERIADSLYRHGAYESNSIAVFHLCIGSEENSQLRQSGVVQIVWVDVLTWIYERYERHHEAKKQHQQWPPVGKALWEQYAKRGAKGREAFVKAISNRMGIVL